MLFCVYDIFYKKKELNHLVSLSATYKGDSVSALSHCIHSYCIEFSS